MKVFITGASGYIGGSVAAALTARGDTVSGLARSEASAGALRERGITPVIGTLDDTQVLAQAARAADVTFNTANAGHREAAEAMVNALAGTGKGFVHTSGSSIVGTRARGEFVAAIFDEDTPYTPTPQRAARVAIDNMVRAAPGVRAIVIAPSLIYGLGHGANPHSIQVPWLIALARKAGVAKHIGSGENRWANVHIDDLVRLYLAAADKAPGGSFYFAENGENSMREMCEAISRMLGQGGRTQSMTVDEAAAEWGEGPANDTMGSNSRVRARRARAELKWTPRERGLIEEIERGCYAGA
ncbi:MAG TPA: NAD-dependent epimerase/dehydratase family protein [Pseudolabrys sp.]|jgi:nucleoside-diphosphate-sugar epimerase|nr:NAD-dependent epimerase/dehydratase family protein [Pseudolabrys sp.]